MRFLATLLLALVLLALTLLAAPQVRLKPDTTYARAASAQAATAGAGGWNREAAATYLDQRMDELVCQGREAANRRRPDDLCLVPHRDPVRAGAAGAEAGDARRLRRRRRKRRLVDETSRRVQRSDPNQLLYEFDEDKRRVARNRGGALCLDSRVGRCRAGRVASRSDAHPARV